MVIRECGQGGTVKTLGLIHHSRGDYGAAVSALKRAGAMLGENPEVHFRLALAYEKLGRTEQAIEAYRRSLSLNPDNPGVKARLDALHRRGKP